METLLILILIIALFYVILDVNLDFNSPEYTLIIWYSWEGQRLNYKIK